MLKGVDHQYNRLMKMINEHDIYKFAISNKIVISHKKSDDMAIKFDKGSVKFYIEADKRFVCYQVRNAKNVKEELKSKTMDDIISSVYDSAVSNGFI